MNTTTIATAWPSASSPMPSTLPISNWIGRTDDSSTSITRLDFSSPMPSAICDPYTLIRIQTTMTVNRPVSRDDSEVDGASSPRTGSETPWATADAAPGTVWIRWESPASCASDATAPEGPPSGTCLTMISLPSTSTAPRSPLRSAASAAAWLGSGTAIACPPDSRPASVMMLLSVVVSPPTMPTRVGLLLPDRMAGSATASATAMSMITVVITNTRVLARSLISRRATSQVIRSAAPSRAEPPWPLAGWAVLTVFVLIAALPSLPPLAMLAAACSASAWPDRGPRGLAEHLGKRPVLVGEVLHGPRRPGEIQDRLRVGRTR